MLIRRYFGFSDRDPLQVVYKETPGGEVLALTRNYAGNGPFKLKWAFEKQGHLIALKAFFE